MSLQFEQPFAEMQAGQTSEGLVANDPLNDNWVVRKAGGSETLFVDELGYNDVVGPGEPIDVRVQVVNAALNIGPADGDYCSESLIRSGYEYEVTVDIEGASTQTRQKCLQIVQETDHEFDFTAPQQPGTYTMTITVEGTGTGFSGGGTREIEVVSEDDDRDDRDRDDRKQEGGGDDPANGGDGGDSFPFWPPGKIIGTGEAVALGGGLALLLVLIIALR